MPPVRVQTPAGQLLRTRQVDALLQKAASLLTSSLDVDATVRRLGDLLVPHFADWCTIMVRDERQGRWQFARPRHADPAMNRLRADIQGTWGAWMQRELTAAHGRDAGKAILVERVLPQWIRQHFTGAARERARRVPARSALFLPLDLDGSRMGAILLLALTPERAPYSETDRRLAQRLAGFAVAAIRNARLWEELTTELAQRRLREESLRESMMTIATLSSGLGHDMGNVLQALRLRLESLGMMELPNHATADLRAIGDVMDYLQRLTNSLRMLAGDARAESAEHAMTRLRSWFNDVQSLMRNALHHSIELQADIPLRLPPARIPAVALTQVVFNLVQHAGQSLGERPGAKVRISAGRVPGTDRIRVRVQDNGPAMAPESLQHIFEPHFSPRGRPASGLGLSLVRTLVERAAGDVSAESGPAGTMFTVTLPIGEARQRPRRRTPEARIARVTIVDSRMRGLVTRTMQRRGFFVDQTFGAPHRQEQVWITDRASLESPDRLFQFADRPDRLALVLNADLPGSHPRIKRLESPAELEDLPLPSANHEASVTRSAAARRAD